MNQTVYEKLKRLAREQKIISYTDLNEECGLFLDFGQSKDRAELGQILGEVSRFEVAHKRPMLSALVLLKRKGDAAYGFYNYADELGVREKGEGDQALLFRQIKACHAYWKDK